MCAVIIIELPEGFRMAKAEAMSSFGDERMLMEEFLVDGRHIEIQVLCVDRVCVCVYWVFVCWCVGVWVHACMCGVSCQLEAGGRRGAILFQVSVATVSQLNDLAQILADNHGNVVHLQYVLVMRS